MLSQFSGRVNSPYLMSFGQKKALQYLNDPGKLIHCTMGFLEHLGTSPEHSSTSTVQAGLFPSVVQPWRFFDLDFNLFYNQTIYRNTWSQIQVYPDLAWLTQSPWPQSSWFEPLEQSFVRSVQWTPKKFAEHKQLQEKICNRDIPDKKQLHFTCKNQGGFCKWLHSDTPGLFLQISNIRQHLLHKWYLANCQCNDK